MPQNDFSGQIIIVTGANVGLGREAARHFVRLNAKKVILACRDTTKGEDARADITRSTGRDDVVEVWPLDLSSFDSVREFCRRAADLERVDVVVENAGVAVVSPSADLVEGYERTITVNVISTFLMALLLLPKLRRTALRFNTQPRLVVVSSEAHFMVGVASILPRPSPTGFSEVTDMDFHRQHSGRGRPTRSSTPSNPPRTPRIGMRSPSCSRSSSSASLPKP